MRYTFEEIKQSVTVNTFCNKCNKKLRRVVKDMQTINPFNKNADGFVKNESEIRQELSASIAKKSEDIKSNGVNGCRACQ